MIALYLRIESIRNIYDSTIQLKLVKEKKSIQSINTLTQLQFTILSM